MFSAGQIGIIKPSLTTGIGANPLTSTLNGVYQFLNLPPLSMAQAITYSQTVSVENYTTVALVAQLNIAVAQRDSQRAEALLQTLAKNLGGVSIDFNTPLRNSSFARRALAKGKEFC